MKKYQIKRTGNRLPVNHNYSELQRRKREAQEPLVIKEVQDQNLMLTKVRNHIVTILEFNDVPLIEAIIVKLVRKYKDDALCDIKEHLLIKEYYQIEDLRKYLTKTF